MYRNCDGIKFLKSLGPGTVDGIFTDPPWGSGPKIYGQGIWLNLLGQLDKEAARVLKPKGFVLIWVGTSQLGKLIKTMRKMEYQWCIYEMHIPSRYAAGYQIRVDPIVIFRLPGTKYPSGGANGFKIDQIFQQVSNGYGKDTLHPCARHIKTVRGILKSFFKEGDYIIDPFAGSDTTGVACRQLGIDFDTCEIDVIMHDHGVKRNSQMYLYQ